MVTLESFTKKEEHVRHSMIIFDKSEKFKDKWEYVERFAYQSLTLPDLFYRAIDCKYLTTYI